LEICPDWSEPPHHASRRQPNYEGNCQFDFAEAVRRKFSDPANRLAAIQLPDLMAQRNRVAVLSGLV
jgi:hypothetical protein